MIKYFKQKNPNFKNIKNLLKESILSNKMTNNSPLKLNFEFFLKKYLLLDDTKEVICVNNGTSALHAIMFYLYSKNKKIKFACSDFTFPSAFVNNFNTTSIDISLNTFDYFNNKNNKKYDAFIVTNLFGTKSQIDSWVNFGKKNNKIIIFDNASSPLSKHNEINICNFGNFSFGSFHHTKYLGFGEGGFIVVPKELKEEFNSIICFGFTGTSRDYNPYTSNFKVSDNTIAYIYDNILQYNLDRHIEIQKRYFNNIKNLLFNYSDDCIYGSIPVIFKKEINKDYFINKNIEVYKYYNPIKNKKNSKYIFSRIINFPINDQLSNNSVDYISEKILEII
jgi:dTDP-4-amino-4,6-dideoxygalactose transaminase